MFWTWDHSTEWILDKPGAQDSGCSDYCAGTPDVFVEDYSRVFRGCGEHGVDAVVIWGFLRDIHGSLETAKRLCEVANHNGVRILAGAGLNAYGGVFYVGNCPFSLKRHLSKHPELLSVDEQGRSRMPGAFAPRKINHLACPSRKENREFAQESLQWLFTELPELQGVQLETGDNGVCYCPLCRERRQHACSSFSWEDMARKLPGVDRLSGCLGNTDTPSADVALWAHAAAVPLVNGE